MGVTVKIIENNKNEIKDELEVAIERALEAVGLQAENYVKMNIPVDTGLLRNSITHAIAGKPAAISSYSADHPKKGQPSTGTYSGSSPYQKNAVYVGTNVEYAPYVDQGHALPDGGHVIGINFMERGIMPHMAEYEKLFEAALKGF